MFKAITLHCGQGEDSTSDIALQYTMLNKNNNAIDEVDYLLFFDSRGLTTENHEISLAHLDLLVKELVKRKKSVIALSRPKNLTIFPTLINFLRLNPALKFKYLMTNVGFVDCTPKKHEFIEDILCQLGMSSSDNAVFLETYSLSNGEEANLYTLDYSSEILSLISIVLAESFEKVYFLNTPEIDISNNLKRSRPKSFYQRLKSSNILINQIAHNINNSYIMDIAALGKDSMLSYDSVHYTTYGHQLIYQKIMDEIS